MVAPGRHVIDRLILRHSQPLQQHSGLRIDHRFLPRRRILIVPVDELGPRVRSGDAVVWARGHVRIGGKRFAVGVAERHIGGGEGAGNNAGAARDPEVMRGHGLQRPRIPMAVHGFFRAALAEHEHALPSTRKTLRPRIQVAARE